MGVKELIITILLLAVTLGGQALPTGATSKHDLGSPLAIHRAAISTATRGEGNPESILQSMIAEAGPNQTSTEGTMVSFEGSVSGVPQNTLNWTKESGVRVDPGGPHDTLWTFQPNVVATTTPGVFRMYYTGHSGTWRILSATSSDQIAWAKESDIRVDTGTSCDTTYAYSPDLAILPNGTFRMYYAGYSGSVFCVLSAWSVDGVNWRKEPGVRVAGGGPYDSVGALSPHVVRLSGGQWRMYYTGADGLTFVILSAISSDGLSWTKEDGIRVAPGGGWDGSYVDSAETIELANGSLRMFYHGNDGTRSRILSAISLDGFVWTKEAGVRLDVGGPFDSVSLGYPDLISSPPGSYRMYYGGYDGNTIRILSAIAEPAPVTVWWDFDIAVDTSGDSIPDNDMDDSGFQANHTYWVSGAYAAKFCAESLNERACDTTTVIVSMRPVETNWKPVAALAFAAGLLSPWLFRRRHLSVEQSRRLLAATAFFIVVELFTGVFSLLTGVLRIPPVLHLGLLVDSTIFAVGLILIMLMSTGSVPGNPPLPPRS